MGFLINQIQFLPDSPGVYLMKAKGEEVLYVGKAKNLRQRVRNYFTGSDERASIPYLLERVEKIDVIVVTTEKEALLLENTLIKKHQPKYNALLKDDKFYLAIKVTSQDVWPKAELCRYRGQPQEKGHYFGPYASAHGARETLELLHKIAPLRQCSDAEFASRKRPCILYDMHRCLAPCVSKCTSQDYQKNVDSTVRFLKGDDKEVIKELYMQMEQASHQMEFEEAGRILNIIRLVEKTVQKQLVDNLFEGNSDMIGLYRQGEEASIAQMMYRQGRLMGVEHFHFVHSLEEDEELLSSFLLQQYYQATYSVTHIYLPLPLSNQSELQDLLECTLHFPLKGDKKKRIEIANENAKIDFERLYNKEQQTEKILVQLQEKCHLRTYPDYIECIDTSNLGGDEAVSSLVCFKKGIPNKSGYKKFKIKQAKAGDDYGALKEVIERRFKTTPWPDLLVIDGGKGHLSMALRTLHEMEIVSVDVIALAKQEGRHDKGSTLEQIFLFERKDAIVLPRNSQLLYLLQRVRDEAHRFAIQFQRVRRSKKQIRSVLDDIEGIGPVKKQALLRHFGSVKKIEQASVEELCAVKGIDKKLAEFILSCLKK